MSGLLMSHREKISSMQRFQTVGLKTTVLLRIVVSICAMKYWQTKLLSLCPLQYHEFVGSVFHWTGKNFL